MMSRSEQPAFDCGGLVSCAVSRIAYLTPCEAPKNSPESLYGSTIRRGFGRRLEGSLPRLDPMRATIPHRQTGDNWPFAPKMCISCMGFRVCGCRAGWPPHCDGLSLLSADKLSYPKEFILLTLWLSVDPDHFRHPKFEILKGTNICLSTSHICDCRCTHLLFANRSLQVTTPLTESRDNTQFGRPSIGSIHVTIKQADTALKTDTE